MLCLCKKFGNGLPGLNHAAFCNPDFTCVRSADKMVQMPKTWHSDLMQTAWFKKTTWVGT